MRQLFEAFEKAGKELYLVGGAVRELLMGRPFETLLDLDFATDATPDETIKILKANGFPCYEVGRRFGTIGTVLRADEAEDRVTEVQITTYRTKEVYRKGSRHPEVEFGTSLIADLARRDFSINAIAMDKEGNVIDPYGGRADLKARRLRLVGRPEEIFSEDPLRLLRAARFIATLGFTPDKPLKAAATKMAGAILEVSRERWFMEMNRLLLGEWVDAALQYLLETRLLGFILPEVAATVGFAQTSPYHHKDVWEHTKLVVKQAVPRPAVRWAALLHDIGKVWTRTTDETGAVHFFRHEELGALLFEGIALRFRFDSDLKDRVQFLILHHLRPNLYRPTWTDAAVGRFVREMGPYLEDLLALSRADITSGRPERRAQGLANLDELEKRVADYLQRVGTAPVLPKGIGRVIMERFNLPEGPQVGALKAKLEQAIDEGVLEPGQPAEYYLTYLERLLKEGQPSTPLPSPPL